MKNYNIPIFVPHMGCPHECVFCNQTIITNAKRGVDQAEVQRIIEEHLETLDSHEAEIEIAFFGGNFTGIPQATQIEYLEVARRFLDEGRVRGIRISTRPDYIDEKRLLMLKSFGVTTVELGVQSLDDKVLKASRRGHSIEDVIRASNLIKYHRMKLGLQMMVGLPGDTYQKTYQTAQKILRLKPDYVRIYPTLVLKDTELCRLYQRGEYQPLDLDTAVEYTGDLLQLFYQSGIKVIRVGLHPTELLTGGDELVAGPFHPAFRSLVESRMYRQSIEEHLAAFKDESIRIRVNSRDRSNLMGNKRENIRYFNQNFPKVSFEIDSGDDVSRYHYEILGKDFKAVYTIF